MRLDDLGGLDRHLVRELGDGDRLRHRHFADDRTRRAGGIAAFVVAMARRPPSGRAIPARAPAPPVSPRSLSARRRAASSWNTWPGAFLVGALALLARLGGRTMQRAFSSFASAAFGFAPAWLRRPWRAAAASAAAFAAASSASRSFLRLARGFALLLFLQLFLLPLLQRLRLARLFLARGDFLRRDSSDGAAAAGAGAGGGRFDDRRRRRRLPARRPAAGATSSTTGAATGAAPLRPRGARARASCAPRPGSCATCRSSRRP